MSLVTVPPFYFPRYPNDVAGGPTWSTTQVQIAAGSNDVSIIFDAPKTGNITKLYWGTGSVTTGCTLDVLLQTVSAGLASGTLVGTGTSGSQVVADTDDNTHFSTTLTNAAAVTRGTQYAAKFDVASGTPTNLGFRAFLDAGLFSTSYYVENTTFSAGAAPYFAVEYDDGSIIAPLGCWTLFTGNTHTFNNSSSPNYRANKFSLAAPKRTCGAWFWADVDGDISLEILDSDGVTVLASRAFSKDSPPSTSAYLNQALFTASVDLAADTDYWLVCRPTTATNFSLYSFNAASATLLTNTFPWAAQGSTASNPTGTGSWTTSTTEQYALGLIVDGIDDGAGGGGGLASNIFTSPIIR